MIIEKDTAAAVKRFGFVENFFGSRYKLSPYAGCTHRCLYCDGRAEKYYLEGDFGKDIQVRPHLPEGLKIELPKLREKGLMLIGSGITDAYQPLEKQRQITAACARELAAWGRQPVIVATKSSLVNRDLTTWKALHDQAGFLLLLTIANLNEEEAAVFEPGASSVAERLKTAALFKAAGIKVGALIMPLLPRLWDTDERLIALLDKLKETGIDFVLPGSLTLRPGIQKETFMDGLKQHYPQLVDFYNCHYRSQRPSGTGDFAYTQKVYDRLAVLLRERALPYLIPHAVYKNLVSPADEIHLLLQHMITLYADKNINTAPLKAAEARYRAWLKIRRQNFNRRRSLAPEHLDEELRLSFVNGGMSEVLDNQKLFVFLRRILLDKETLDYNTLKL
jgi:DNA repair photolyase